MKKRELIKVIAARAELNRKDAAKVLDTFLSLTVDALKEGENVQLYGFGTFTLKKRAATTAYNIQTGGRIVVPERKVPVFKAGKGLTEAVQQ